MTELLFTKMHGLGNDFVVIDDLGPQPATQHPLTPKDAREICDRRFGIGADQILWLRKPKDTSCDARMEILNSDGSIAEMCGNGIRAVGVYLAKRESEKKQQYAIETLAGLIRVTFQGEEVEVDMGPPHLGAQFFPQGEQLQVLDQTLSFFEVSMGNPHAVVFVESLKGFDFARYGAVLEKHSRFPKRTNVEFVEVLHPDAIEVRVWERGAGVTLACGTGACAAAVASIALGKTKSQVEVGLLGGKLRISWAGEKHSVRMVGPATEVYRGVYLRN